jgi:hypothetical protein
MLSVGGSLVAGVLVCDLKIDLLCVHPHPHVCRQLWDVAAGTLLRSVAFVSPPVSVAFNTNGSLVTAVLQCVPKPLLSLVTHSPPPAHPFEHLMPLCWCSVSLFALLSPV